MDNFNFKQYLFESRVGMYSRAALNENALLDAETLAGEVAKQHPEIIRYHHDGETRKFQDAVFKYAGEILRDGGIPLQTVRGLAYDADWAMDLVSSTKGALERGDLEEMNPAALGAPQAAADAEMQQQDDRNRDMVDNVSMGLEEEDDSPMEAAYGNVGSVDKVAPADSGINKYLDVLRNYDWFHHFADDPRAWNQGQSDKVTLRGLYATLTPEEKQQAIDAFTDKYLAIHDPKQFPGAANNVKYLTTDTFNGVL
jgi:hypothetical protein